MELTGIIIIFVVNVQFRIAKAQEGLLQNFIEQTNFLLFNSSYVIDDTENFLPSYDFIIVGSGSGGW